MLDKGKHFPQSYAKMLFSTLGIHHDEQLLITIDPWDERRARELMQEELLIRLYNHVYADPVYWNHLDVEARIFQLASAIAAVEPDAIFCGSTAALLYGIGSAYSLLNAVQMLLPRSSRRDTYEFVEYRRWRPGEVWRLGPFTLTDPYRTVVDIARTSAFRYALGYVDGLAREYDVDREELRAYAQTNCRGLHGISRAFGVFEYMDGRSDNGGESEARAAMILLASLRLSFRLRLLGQEAPAIIWQIMVGRCQMGHGCWQSFMVWVSLRTKLKKIWNMLRQKPIEPPYCAMRTCAPWVITSFISNSRTHMMSKSLAL